MVQSTLWTAFIVLIGLSNPVVLASSEPYVYVKSEKQMGRIDRLLPDGRYKIMPLNGGDFLVVAADDLVYAMDPEYQTANGISIHSTVKPIGDKAPANGAVYQPRYILRDASGGEWLNFLSSAGIQPAADYAPLVREYPPISRVYLQRPTGEMLTSYLRATFADNYGLFEGSGSDFFAPLSWQITELPSYVGLDVWPDLPIFRYQDNSSFLGKLIGQANWEKVASFVVKVLENGVIEDSDHYLLDPRKVTLWISDNQVIVATNDRNIPLAVRKAERNEDGTARMLE